MKRGKISNTEKNFIYENRHLAPEAIAKELDRNTTLIKDILNNFPKEEPQKMNKSILDQGRRKQARVMTPAISEISDSTKRKKTLNPDIIHKPLG